MDSVRNIDIHVDLYNQNYIPLNFKQYDNTKLNFIISNNGVSANLSGNSFILNFIKGDKTLVVQTSGFDTSLLSSGKVSVTLVEDCLRAYGKGNLELLIVKDGNTISNFIIDCIIQGSVIDDTIPSSNVVTLTEELNETIQEGINTKEDLENVIATADTTTYATKGEINEVNSLLEDIVQVSIKRKIYRDLVIDDDWSPAIEAAIAANPNAEIFIPPSTSVYNFSRKIALGRYNSLYVARGATIKATSAMPIFIEKHNQGMYTLSQYNRIHGGGLIDGNRLADDVISLGGYRHFILNDLKILNPLHRGVVSRYQSGIFAVELMANNIYIENDSPTNRNTIGIESNSSDSHYTNIITVNMDIGIRNTDGSNRFITPHSWIYQPARLDNSIAFMDLYDGIWDKPYADTAPIGFHLEGNCRIINPTVFNSPEFPISGGSIAFKIPGYNRGIKIIENARIIGSSVSVVNKAVDGTYDECIVLVGEHYCNQYVIDPLPKRIKTVVTKPHQTTDNRYYHFATIKIPKQSMGNTISGRFLITNNNDNNPVFRGINSVDFVIKAFTSTTLLDISHIKYTFTVNGRNIEGKISITYEDLTDFINIKLYYDFSSAFDYLQIKLDTLMGSYGWYDQVTYLEEIDKMYGRRIVIHDNNNFISSITETLLTISPTTPTQVNISPASGVNLSSNDENVYSKTTDNRVTIHFKVNKGTTTDGIASGTTLFTMPVGYRPLSNRYFSFCYDKQDGSLGAAYGAISGNGDVKVYNATNVRNVAGTLTYYSV